MRNRVVKQMFMFGMASMLAVSNPVVGWASESETKDETQDKENDGKEESDTINITKENPTPVIYDENDIKISVQSTAYEQNGGDPLYRINFMIENNSKEEITLYMNDSYVDDFETATYQGNCIISAGKKGISDASIWEKNFVPYGVEDFKTWETSMKITSPNKTFFEQKIKINADVFDISTTDSENADQNSASDTESSEETTDTNEIMKKIESLETENKELKEKIKQLEEEKNQPSPAPTVTPEPTAVPEPTETPEPTAAPEPQPVVEYKDATTIRIVQQTLNDKGYNCGNPDGVAGGNTSKAITQYQTENGITENGLVTDELLQSLGIVEKVQEAVAEEASKNEYSADYTYDQLARNPDANKGKKVKFRGKVLQTGDAGSGMNFARVELNDNLDTVLFVTYSGEKLGYRLLDDDMITLYGETCGVYSYESTGSGVITLPWIHADIIEM